MIDEPFRLLMRVRYSECDGQGIVFNSRMGDYVDVGTTEYTRVVFGGVDPAVTGLDWRLVKQTVEWYAPARFDDVLDLRVRTVSVGTTSFSLATEIRRYADQTRLAEVETIYVMVEPAAGTKRPVPDAARAALDRGAPDHLVDHAAARR